MKGLKVLFTVKSTNGKKYFSSIGGGGRPINLSNFPPFFELMGSKIYVKTSKHPNERPSSCSIVARELPKIPRDLIVRSCFSERMEGSPWPYSTIEAVFLDQGDYIRVVVSEKSGITTREDFRTFLLLRHYAIVNVSLSRVRDAFNKKIQKMGKKSITEKDVLEHFDFPEVLYFPW